MGVMVDSSHSMNVTGKNGENNNSQHTSFRNTRKFTRRASKRWVVLFAVVRREPGVIIRHVLFAAGWREPGVVCYHI